MTPKAADLIGILPEIIWCGFAVLLMLLQPFLKNRQGLTLFAMVGAAAGTLATYFSNSGSGFFGLVQFDMYSVFFHWLVGLVAFLVILAADSYLERENLAPYRILHFLALSFLFTFVVPRNWRGFRLQALQPLIKCGEEWLAVFCSGVFLSFAAHFILITGPNSLAMQVLVSAAGITIMTGVAYYVSWSKRQDYKSALSART